MHIEKNVYENMIKFIFGLKDIVKVQRDMEVCEIRKHLWLKRDPQRPSKIFKHVAPCCNPSFGLATKAKGLQGCGPKGRKPGSQGKGIARVRAKRKPGSHITYSWECKKVWESEHSHSQGNSHFGRWSPNGLLKLQKAIARVKTQWLVAFFISLESSWNLDV